MQGYENPLVVKEINLPIPPYSDDPITLQQYKEKYGIDLSEIMSFTFEADAVEIRFKDYSKINLVYSNKGYPGIPNVVSINSCEIDQGAFTLICRIGAELAIGLRFEGTSMENLTIAGYEN